MGRKDDLNRILRSPPLYARNRKSHVKLIVSAYVLGGVFLVAAYQQFSGGWRRTDTGMRSRNSYEAPTERTVYGGPPNASGAAARSEAAGGSDLAASKSRAIAANVPPDMQALLNSWRTTLISGDASAHADLYTSRVDRFLKRRNVSRREVRRETEKVLSRYPKSRRYEISDVAVEKMDGGKAVLTFRKDWDVRGRGQFAGAARQRLTLRNEAGSWKINGEEETKVYWARRR
jgi:hypothetical protein